MDASLQYWPKIGDTVTYTGKGAYEKFLLINTRDEFPTKIYIIQSKLTGKTFRTHRHELNRVYSQDALTKLRDEVNTSYGRYLKSTNMPKDASTHLSLINVSN